MGRTEDALDFFALILFMSLSSLPIHLTFALHSTFQFSSIKCPPISFPLHIPSFSVLPPSQSVFVHLNLFGTQQGPFWNNEPTLVKIYLSLPSCRIRQRLSLRLRQLGKTCLVMLRGECVVTKTESSLVLAQQAVQSRSIDSRNFDHLIQPPKLKERGKAYKVKDPVGFW